MTSPSPKEYSWCALDRAPLLLRRRRSASCKSLMQLIEHRAPVSQFYGLNLLCISGHVKALCSKVNRSLHGPSLTLRREKCYKKIGCPCRTNIKAVIRPFTVAHKQNALAYAAFLVSRKKEIMWVVAVEIIRRMLFSLLRFLHIQPR